MAAGFYARDYKGFDNLLVTECSGTQFVFNLILLSERAKFGITGMWSLKRGGVELPKGTRNNKLQVILRVIVL